MLAAALDSAGPAAYNRRMPSPKDKPKKSPHACAQCGRLRARIARLEAILDRRDAARAAPKTPATLRCAKCTMLNLRYPNCPMCAQLRK